ncbi:solute carrier family 15 member 4 [Galendromus occidentalis]|uniref:Solute carrier family 15 member 4 n=1 Tax=Galendromus occidentalis TaxID=34638 RepID=A0AAJ6QNI7_9ACAR|nr:solute carrier family 15 member 4 [Galendromus occidentalis]
METSGNHRSDGDDGDTTSLSEDYYSRSVDFRGDRVPVALFNRLQRKRNLACASILFTVFAERVAFYALSGNLYLFLNHHPLAWTSTSAMTALLVFTGTAFVGAFLTGYLGDALGRFRIILVSLLVYIVGLIAFVAIAQYQNGRGGDFIGLCHIKNRTNILASSSLLSSLYPQTESEASSHGRGATMQCGATIYVLLVITGLASSGIKANVVPFGAEQVKQENRMAVRRYFTIYYWVVNIAAFLSILILSYIQQSTSGGFGLGYIIPTVILVLAFFLFWISKGLFVQEQPEPPILYNIFQVLVEAWQQNRVHQRPPNRQWLDAAKIEFGGRFDNELVEDVKQLKFVLGVFALLIPYWVVYFQMQTSFQEQGLHMRLLPSSMFAPINQSDAFTIPAAWLTLFNVMFVILFVPVFEKCIYPSLESRQSSPSINLRMFLGLLCAVLAMLCAGGVEVKRLELVHENRTIVQIIDKTDYVAADMWVFWQIPSYFFVGLSEILASISGVELAYSHAPVSMQGIVMGLFYLSTGIGCFAGSLLLSLVSPYWLNSSPNTSRLDLFFWLLAGIQLVSSILFFLCVVRRSRNLFINTYASIQ